MDKKIHLRFDGAAPLPIMLYLISVCAALMYAICRSRFLPCTLIMSVLTVGIFLLFYKLRSRPMPTALCVFGFIIAAWTAGCAAGAHEYSDGGFMDFLFTASARFDPFYAAAAIFIFSLVIGFIGCYFSVMSPRPCFLMLLMFIPLILSSRTLRELPVYFVLIMNGCFVFASANLALPCPESGTAVFEEKRSRRRRLLLSGTSALVITLVAALLPRSTETPLKDYLDKLVPRTGGYNMNTGLTQNFALRSSVNTGENQQPDEVLFSVVTDSPQLIKRCAFDQYSEDGWIPLDDYNQGSAGWEYNAEIRNGQRLLESMLNYPEMVDENYRYLTEGLDSDYSDYQTSKMIIYLRSGVSTYVVMHPETTYLLSLPDEAGRSYMTPRGDCFSERPMPDGTTYALRCTSPAPNAEFLRRMDDETFLGLLDSSFTTIKSSILRAQYQDAQDYLEKTGDIGITPEIQALVDEITAGVTNDYDKAMALEAWFGEAGFVYDLAFVPEEHTPDYFLFRSRRGICSDYASALTLMARAAGLPARYCEGFAMPESTYNEVTDAYDITGSQGHAWTEVYIPGGGWISLDGTQYAVSADENAGELPMWLIIAAAGAALVVLALYIFRKPLGWLVFQMTYPLKKKDKRVLGVYLRARKIAADISGADENSLAAGETEKLLSDRLGMPQQAAEICSAADRLLYSPETSDENTKRLLDDLRALKKRRRRLGK